MARFVALVVAVESVEEACPGVAQECKVEGLDGLSCCGAEHGAGFAFCQTQPTYTCCSGTSYAISCGAGLECTVDDMGLPGCVSTMALSQNEAVHGTFTLYNEDLWCGTARGPAASLADGDCFSWADNGSFTVSLKYDSTAAYPYTLFQGANCDPSFDTRSYQDGICGSLPTAQQAYGGKGIKFGPDAVGNSAPVKVVYGAFTLYNEDLWCGTARGPAASLADGDCFSWADDGSFTVSLKYDSTAAYPYTLFQGANCDPSFDTRSYQDGICGSLPTAQQAYGGKGIKFGPVGDAGEDCSNQKENMPCFNPITPSDFLDCCAPGFSCVPDVDVYDGNVSFCRANSTQIENSFLV